MNTQRARVSAIMAAAGLVLALSACTAAQPTPIYVYLTPTPAPTGTPTPVVTATPAPTPTSAPTAAPGGASASPTATAAASATAAGATPTSGPIATAGPASACSGAASAKNEAFWADAANEVPFAVYCGVVPSGWSFMGASDAFGASGNVTATYTGPGTAKIVIQEGAFCTSGAAACSPHDSVIGSANFGDLSGSLDAVGSGFAIYVSPGTAHGYTATGTDVSQATFVSIVGALVKIAKS